MIQTMKSNKELQPTNGMLVTKRYYTDTQGGKIREVLSKNCIRVGYFTYPSAGEDTTFGEDAEYDTNYEDEIWSRRKSGRWRIVGRPDKRGECSLFFGHARSRRIEAEW